MSASRKSLIILFLFGLFSEGFCQSKHKKEVTLEAIELIQKEMMTQNVIMSLSNDIYLGRSVAHRNIEYTKLFLENVLSSQKIKPYGKSYRIPFTIKDSLKSDIIVGYIDNKVPNKTIIITANYDNMGMVRNDDEPYADSIYNGANDNATGVAALFQLASAFKYFKMDYNLLICFTSGKHYAMCGAGYLADTLRHYNIKPILALNFEMLGKKVNGETKAYILSDELSNLRTLINQSINEPLLEPILSDEDMSQNEKSEHTPFYNVFHIPSHTITTFNYKNDENYLTPADDIKNIDIKNTHFLINKFSYALFKILSENEKLIFKEKSQPNQ